MNFVEHHSQLSGIKRDRFITWIGVTSAQYYRWKKRLGQPNQHNGQTPKEHWLLDCEKERIIDFYQDHRKDGYRRLSYIMLDAGLVAVSPSSIYRVLSNAGLLRSWPSGETSKGKGFNQPKEAHKHWHTDVTHINIQGTFYYLCSVLDGFSRYMMHWEIREAMTEKDVEIILQRALEKFPDVNPRLISDNGPQFIARDFKEFIRISGMTHVRTSPYYPQANGKQERWHGSLKRECIRPKTPLSLEDARRIVEEYVEEYNTIRLHSAIGYVTPEDRLTGRDKEIQEERKRRLKAAKEQRKIAWKMINEDQQEIA